jgi:hypothetical protein
MELFWNKVMWRVFRPFVLILLALSLSAGHAVCACAEAGQLALSAPASPLAAALPEAHDHHGPLARSADALSDDPQTETGNSVCDHAPGACSDAPAVTVMAPGAAALMTIGGEQNLVYACPRSAAAVHTVLPPASDRAAPWPRPPPPVTPVTLKVRLLN